MKNLQKKIEYCFVPKIDFYHDYFWDAKWFVIWNEGLTHEEIKYFLDILNNAHTDENMLDLNRFCCVKSIIKQYIYFKRKEICETFENLI